MRSDVDKVILKYREWVCELFFSLEAKKKIKKYFKVRVDKAEGFWLISPFCESALIQLPALLPPLVSDSLSSQRLYADNQGASGKPGEEFLHSRDHTSIRQMVKWIALCIQQ